MRGFLVVRTDLNLGAPYKGVDRVPTYPAEFPEEAAASEQYALGDFKSEETNMIATVEKAVELLRMFPCQGQGFEIILCESGDTAPSESQDGSATYGYDVASLNADYWSIVRDMSQSPWAMRYRTATNEFGLFADHATAKAYLHEYRAHSEPDSDAPFAIVRVTPVLL
jgi:hypothetical protein